MPLLFYQELLLNILFQNPVCRRRSFILVSTTIFALERREGTGSHTLLMPLTFLSTYLSGRRCAGAMLAVALSLCHRHS